MAESAGARELGERLTELKIHSGRSYESIGRRVNLGKSTVHRYCTGAAVPVEFGTVERIGLACGADTAELLTLHRLWVRALASRENLMPAEPEMRPDPTLNGVAAPAPVPVAIESTAVVRAAKRGWMPAAALLVFVLALLTGSTSAPSPSAPAAPSTPSTPQWVTGPSWMRPPVPVPRELFGVTINSAVGAMPTFQVGAARLWDSGTRWSEIAPQRGYTNFATLDRLVKNAREAGLPALFVFGGTPRWAAPNGGMTPYSDQSSSAPPDDLREWDRFVTDVARRYKGRIEAYELWVLANDKLFYSGSIETLVEMTARASAILHAEDPDATVVCPGMGKLWTAEGMAFLRRFAELGGYDYCDVAGVKLFQRRASDPPESMLELTAALDAEFHALGIHPPVWNTGTTYTIPLEAKLDEAKARSHAVRFYLTGLYAYPANITRMYFYNWGGTKIPIVLQPVGGSPTTAALAIEQLQMWLANTKITGCSHGPAARLPDNVWQCDFLLPATGPAPRHAVIRWTHAGTAKTAPPPNSHTLHHLDGTTEPLIPGRYVTVTTDPVLIEHG